MHWEIFGGYSWFAPNGRIGATKLDNGMTSGFAVSASYFTNKYVGVNVLGSYHDGDREKIGNISAGPIVRFPIVGLSPFIHANIGAQNLSPKFLPGSNWGPAIIAGGGLDLNLPSLTHFKIRVVQADYVYSHHNFFPITPRPNLNSVELSTGIVYAFKPITPPVPPTVACAVQPSEVFAGEPVNVTVTPANFNPKRTVTYSYTTTGGKVSGTGPTTTIDTTGANPGQYTVTANATDGKMKAPVSCNASYTVKEWPAPQISCSANPTDIDPGQTSQIQANASTIKGGLKYSYSASTGTVEGEGPNVTFNSQGAQPGAATVTCTVTDDRGKTAQATTTVNVRQPVAPPPPPPPPSASKLNEIAFTKPYSSRVDNTAKAVLDDVALRLQREPDAKAVVIGDLDPKETSKVRTKNLAAMRAVNTKAYLVNEKGIDPNRIETRTNGPRGAKSEIWIVPSGATFSDPETQVTNLPTPKKAPARHTRRPAKKPAQ
jgi:hypothetical protein